MSEIKRRALTRQDMDDAIRAYGEAEYWRGLDAGLAVAERIRGWLTRQPDTEEQREVRTWVDAALEKAKKRER